MTSDVIDRHSRLPQEERARQPPGVRLPSIKLPFPGTRVTTLSPPERHGRRVFARSNALQIPFVVTNVRPVPFPLLIQRAALGTSRREPRKEGMGT